MRGLLGLAGLVGLLITIGIMMYIFADYMTPVSKAAKKAGPQANQMAGRSPSASPVGQGTPVLQDSSFSPVEQSARLTGLKVTVMPTTNGLYEFFGLIPGDVILRIGPFKMGDETLSDFEAARDWVQEGMQRH